MLQKRPVFGRGVFCLPAPCTQRVGFTQKNRLETVQAEGEGGKSCFFQTFTSLSFRLETVQAEGEGGKSL